NPGHYLG
nr:insulin-degrading enzyme, IDE, atrial natriuretic peptide (ANP)-binding protein=peptide 2 {EC 3.4.22.11} [rats, brain, Peptide Partial, 7 aa] [Rattus sp.]